MTVVSPLSCSNCAAVSIPPAWQFQLLPPPERAWMFHRLSINCLSHISLPRSPATSVQLPKHMRCALALEPLPYCFSNCRVGSSLDTLRQAFSHHLTSKGSSASFIPLPCFIIFHGTCYLMTQACTT